MSYTAQPPVPPKPLKHEFTVTFALAMMGPNESMDIERRIAQALAPVFGTAVTAAYQPPF
jgi:hypothetical protein